MLSVHLLLMDTIHTVTVHSVHESAPFPMSPLATPDRRFSQVRYGHAQPLYTHSHRAECGKCSLCTDSGLHPNPTFTRLPVMLH